MMLLDKPWNYDMREIQPSLNMLKDWPFSPMGEIINHWSLHPLPVDQAAAVG